MVLTPFVYFKNNKKLSIKVKPCTSIWSKVSGLMFRKNSPPLLFILNKNQSLTIHSFFCKPFKAIWIDDKKQITKEEVVKNWKPAISGYGKYLLEIPISSIKAFTRE
jgi:uncharacterized membrane protein (UPF0127 family)